MRYQAKRLVALALAFTMVFGGSFAFWPGTSVQAATVSSTDISKQAISLIGTPYQYGGASPQTGFDTSGLVYYIYQKSGMNVPRTVKYQAFYGIHVERNQLQAGDVVFFSYKGDYPNFVGIYVGNGQFVSSVSGKVAIHSLTSVYYNSKYFGARRFITDGQAVAKPTTVVSNNTTSNTGSSSSNVPTTTHQSPTLTNQLADAIIQTGLKYWGVDYKFGADYDKDGSYLFDCSSFTQKVYGENGIKLPRSSRQQSTVGTYIKRSDIRKGDLLFFATAGKYVDGKPYVDHVGIAQEVLSNGTIKILHTYKPGLGVTTSMMYPNSGYWNKTFLFAKRVIQ
ncbi:C40 family peptidase [Tepidibacillus fermentans]|uniref:Cell wall-associated NlpC family hydrolase n=1 Tax=Tepidibacillus fermentans TaxID=1281767 RepID=A0A4R3KLC9_9BACI|nr:C40 family peptidase [Tepidibacillus fermentans]TCS83600.1 cell wall-associated NlpC family hydrolase [Tepidibacillus fermentans]